jgi:hypothetical protein
MKSFYTTLVIDLIRVYQLKIKKNVERFHKPRHIVTSPLFVLRLRYKFTS